MVLVHGAWHGAWCWEKVTKGLADKGVPTVAVDLPGHGDDPGPLSDLFGDAVRVTEMLDTIDGPAVLVGHSYGGAVISQAGVHDAVDRLVYLCAMVLDEGESCASAAADTEAPLISNEGRPSLSAGFKMRGDGSATLDPSVAAACLYNDCDSASTAWALSRLTPQSLLNMGQEVTAAAWRVKPSTYVVCTDDMAVHPGLQRVLARRCTNSVEWNASHSPFLSQPETVVQFLAGLAAR